MMTWNTLDLKYFLEVAQTLNISRAAERLGVGQPALSQAMRRLEESFGVVLLDRYKTGVRLTTAGQRLREEGHKTLENFDRLKELVVGSNSLIEGQYSIGCHPSVALYTLPHFLKDLMSTNPGLSFRLVHGLSREVLEEVVSFKVDFGIVINPVRHPNLVIKELARDRVGFWVAANGVKDTLIYDPSLNQTQSLLQKMKKLSFKRTIESANLEVIAELAESGCGAAILPGRVAKRFPKLRKLESHLSEVEDVLCLVYRSDRQKSAAAKLIIETIRELKV